MFYVTTSINGKITGRLLSEKKTQERAASEVERIVGLGTYTRPGETVIIVEAANRMAMPREIASAPVMTDDMQEASIMGANHVMNRDF